MKEVGGRDFDRGCPLTRLLSIAKGEVNLKAAGI
jgi:hypothetical protein